jgi:ParB family transcriptional regulator, chromosome partitioning protein
MEKKALGRGLDALLPTTKPAPMPELPEVQHLRLDAIVPNRFQPRQTFPPQELAELAASLFSPCLFGEKATACTN